MENTGLSRKKSLRFLRRFSIKTYQQARRIVRIIIGLTLLVVGLAMVVLPGPATVVLPIALGILAGEFFWARWVMAKFNRTLLALLEINQRRRTRRKRKG